jgi:hypothetical protein
MVTSRCPAAYETVIVAASAGARDTNGSDTSTVVPIRVGMRRARTPPVRVSNRVERKSPGEGVLPSDSDVDAGR